MNIQQTPNTTNYKNNPKNTSFQGLFRINLYNFQKANRKISRELLKDTFCQNGSIRIDGRQYPKKRILDLYTYFICENKNDQYFINRLRKMGLNFDCTDEPDKYEIAIKALTICSKKMSGPIKSLMLRRKKELKLNQ